MGEAALARQLATERADAVRTLLGRPVLDAAADPDAFRLVARHRPWLEVWFDTTCGWPLAVDPAGGFARLAKRSDHPDGTRPARRARGSNQPFDRRRYELLCLVAAELTSHPVTTVGLLAQAITSHTSGEDGTTFDTTVQRERAAFVDALKLLRGWGAVSFSGGDVDVFVANESGNAMVTADTARLHRLLACPTGPSKVTVTTTEEAVTALMREPRYADVDHDVATDGEGRRRWVRHSLARRLLDDPALYYDDLTDEQGAYLASPTGRRWLRERTRDAGFVLEERAEGMLAVDPEQLATDVVFPAPNSTVKQVALILAGRLVAEDGTTRRLRAVERSELESAVGELFERHPAWAREYRDEGGISRLTAEAVTLLHALELVRIDDDIVEARPALARYRPEAPVTSARTLWEGTA